MADLTDLDALQTYFNELLNENPYGKFFNMGQFIKQSGTEFRLDFVPSSVISYKVNYVPCMLSGVDAPKNIPDLDLYEWVFTLRIALTGENEKKDPQLSERRSLNWFRKKLVDEPLATITSDETDYNIVTTGYHIGLDSVTSTVSGKKRSLVSMQIGVQSGIGVFFGNSLELSLRRFEDADEDDNYYPIKKLGSGHKKNKVVSSGFVLTGSKTDNIAIDSAYGYNTVVVYEENVLLTAIMSEILLNGTLNTKYVLRTVFEPLGTIPDRTVLLTGGVINDNNGQFITLAFDIVDTIDA
jgi:hypothetical protein